MKFHVNQFDGMASGYYAVRNSDGKESAVYPFKWLAWLAGWTL